MGNSTDEGCGCASEGAEDVIRWWRGLPSHPAEARFLRRCDCIAEASSSPLVRSLYALLPAFTVSDAAALAVVLAQVDEDDPETRFICKLGLPAERPAFSEFHFERLRASRSVDELARRTRRAIVVLGRRVHLRSLVECFLDWLAAQRPFSSSDSRLRSYPYRWMEEYRAQRSDPGHRRYSPGPATVEASTMEAYDEESNRDFPARAGRERM